MLVLPLSMCCFGRLPRPSNSGTLRSGDSPAQQPYLKDGRTLRSPSLIWTCGANSRTPASVAGGELSSSTSPLSLDTLVTSDKDVEDQGLSDVTKVPRGKGRRSLTGKMLREDERYEDGYLSLATHEVLSNPPVSSLVVRHLSQCRSSSVVAQWLSLALALGAGLARRPRLRRECTAMPCRSPGCGPR